MPDNTSSIIPIGGGSSGGGAATSITVGTTTVTGGGTNRILYEDAAQLVAASTSLAFDGTTLTVGVPGAANSVAINETAGKITFEGATADAFETRIGVVDPTVGDQNINFPNLGAATTDTVATLGLAQTFSGQTTFSAANATVFTTAGPTVGLNSGYFAGSTTVGTAFNSFGGFGTVSGSTPNLEVIWTGTVSNALHIFEAGDFAFNFANGSAGAGAQTDPTLIIHSHNQSTTQYLELRHNGTDAVIAVGTGALDQTLVTGGDKLLRTITAGGTTGAQTINKPAGTVNFAAAATTLVVTNSLVNASSLIFCTVRTADTTALLKNVVAGAGSFTITMNAAVTAETSVGFFVTN